MRTLATTALLALLVSSSANADLARMYEFNQNGTLPSSEPNTVYFAQFNSGSPAPELSVFSVTGGLLRQRTTGFNGAKEYLLGQASGGNIINGGLDASRPLDCQARLRVLSSTGQFCASLDVIDGQNRRSVAIVASGLVVNFVTPVTIPAFDMTQFHTIRITSPGGSNSMKVYVDGALVVDGQGVPLASSNGMQWGDLSSAFSTGQGADVDWDYIYLANTLPTVPALSRSGVAVLLLMTGLLGSLAVLRRSSR